LREVWLWQQKYGSFAKSHVEEIAAHRLAERLIYSNPAGTN
jgi:hypothetical protein